MGLLFNIFKTDKAEAPKITTSLNAPSQHDFEEFLIGNEGEQGHSINFKITIIDS